MKTKLYAWLLAFCLLPLAFTLPGCGILKPAPIAPGADAVVVNAERVQQSSLAIYEQVTNWELTHRLTLTPEVSRAIDRYRKEFPAAWRLSRSALADYKLKRGDTLDAVARTTAALSAAQTALMSLQMNQTDNEILQANNAIAILIQSVRALAGPTPVTP